jgi:glucose-6-phosphate 1-dehydrogenase
MGIKSGRENWLRYFPQNKRGEMGMNINGFARGYMSNNHSGEEFIKHVVEEIEQQLIEWDHNYEVFLLKLSYYEIMVKKEDHYYHVKLSENEVNSLQKRGPFQLDRKIWKELEKQGITIIKGHGNYIDTVL